MSNGSQKVALLLPELRIGGAQKVFLILAKEFIARGIDVDLVLLTRDGELLGNIPKKVRLITLTDKPISTDILSILDLVKKLTHYLKENRPDALLSTLTGTNMVAVVAKYLSGIPVKLVLREAASFANIPRTYIKYAMRILYKKADSIIVLNEYMMSEMRDQLNITPQKLHQIPNPIDLEYIRNQAIEDLPATFNTSISFIVAVGRLAPQKDYFTLLDAFAKFHNKKSLKLVILGEGSDRVALEERISDLSLGEKVELRGFDPNPYRWIARSSLFVMSSRWEGYPNVLLEAMALGKPVVSTCYDESVYAILGNQIGAVVPVGDSSAFAKAISENISLKTASCSYKYLPKGVMNSPLSYIQVMGCDDGRQD